MIKFAGSLVAALLISTFASAAIAAGPFGSINIGNWKGGAYTDDKKRTFSHCGAASEDQNGNSIAIAKDVRGHFVLSLAYPAWQIMPGRKFPITATFGEHEHLHITGIAATSTTINATVLNNVCDSPHQSGESQPTATIGSAPGSSGLAAFLGGNAERPKNQSKAQSCRRFAFVDHFRKSHLLVVEANARTFQVELVAPGQLLSAISNCVATVKSGGIANAGDFTDGQKASAVTAPDDAKASAAVPLVSGPEQTLPMSAAPQRPGAADTAVPTHISTRVSPPSRSAPPENSMVSSITEPTSSLQPTTTATASFEAKRSENLIDITGAGLVIDHHGYIATANHVVSNCVGEIHANLTGDSDMVLQIVSADVTNDLALLRAPRRFNDVGLIRGSSILVGDPVIVIGTSQKPELDLAADKGFVSSLSGLSNDTRFMQISVPTQLNSDGAPVLDIKGGVVGLIAKKRKSVNLSVATNSGVPDDTNFAIKSGAIRGFLDNSAVAYQMANLETELATAQIVNNAKAYTVIISCKTR
jgi:hypothetical protein